MNKDWLDIAVLEDYLEGKLDAKTMNRIEREALEDPFVAEALAGLSESPARSLNSLSLLQKQLQERVAEQKHTKKTAVITWQRLSIAATAAVMFVAVSVMFWMREENRQKQLASMPKKVDVNIAPKVFKDSVSATADAIATNSKPDVVMDKAIIAAKENSYAALKDKKSTPIVTEAPPLAQVRMAAPEKQLNEVVVAASPVDAKRTVASSVTVIQAESKESDALKKEVTAFGYAKAKSAQLADTGIASALQGKVAGIQVITGDNQRASRFTIDANDTKDIPVANIEMLDIPGKNLNSISTHPIDGWPEFNEYLIKTNRYKKDAKGGESAQLRFEVKNQRPINISIIKGISGRFDREIIRLIRTGSDWKVQDPKNPIVFITINF